MGVRPQHMRLGAPNDREHVGFGGNLMVTEQLGDEQVLAVRIGGGDIRVAGVDPELALATGTRIDVAVPLENLHLFDAASGAAIR
jgi:multiple sugar transport system ATP-binding protein